MLNLALTTAGNFRLIYYQEHIGNSAYKGYKIPLIDLIELPFTVESRILAVGASFIAAPPTWHTAGYLFQEIGGIALDDSLIFPGVGGGGPLAVLDATQKRITLNTIELHVFPRFASEHRYRFEPVRWLPRVTLGIWEYIGAESDSTETLITSLQSDVTQIKNSLGV